MKQKPRLYILPGWGEKVSDTNYQELISYFMNHELYPLKTKTRNRKYALGSDKSYVEAIDDIHKQLPEDTEEDIILGFSIGALEAFELAKRNKFKKVILCSISPSLGSDMAEWSYGEVSGFSKLQYIEMKKMRYGKLKSNPILVLHGEKEDRTVKSRSKKLGRRKGVKLTEVKNADHEIDKVYLREIKSSAN